ncbi:MAG: exodeoxyribonuclease III [Bdellovibrionales bacterium RIFOXYB1_FULL_37_110]|nr:MAG: exodeoxyribonuclease III [Bdellovibrionales bacterium RIFOXYA1_FULL_38_20]OFZ51461.1 MAG: exodeoxyribonuclease III [Bdellovibrionales bacterium RIFOXYC1_FULL_37_79]OFZ53281.1 MAG: exodeoxyribonuclease III [Bdellovibrionales bacterium RIFOXYB2_FULL_36_6]OFZ57889.1 MAG: exodeoxyribonuclease III [Bdellovibrionales bacterium RIFOXYB1_FULL_37_110]OFZ63615.1 MAG: exodeoxyribonuclease III [Bdellovibrionales bacterium RIFOXYD1_FULL_36_51]
MKRLATWNVNGLRAIAKKNFISWLKQNDCQIIALQETKLNETQIPPELLILDNYHSWYASALTKGYSGVALYSHKLIEKPTVEIGLGISKFDEEGRTIIAHYHDFIFFACYFPNGGRDLFRVPYKLEYSDAVLAKALFLKEQTKKEIIIAGDFNTAHLPIDLKNPKSNEGNTGFLPIERAWLDKLMQKGFVDIFRKQHPKEEGQYTWWSYRYGSRNKNIGWRLDYFFISSKLESKIRRTWHGQDVPGSDHCPSYLELE